MWPFRRRPVTLQWAREVVTAIPREDLPNHILTFADCLRRSRNPEAKAKHFAKIVAACERLEVEQVIPLGLDAGVFTVRK